MLSFNSITEYFVDSKVLRCKGFVSKWIIENVSVLSEFCKKYVYDIESKWPWIIEGFHGIDFFLFKFLQMTLFLQGNKQFQCKMMLLDLISKNKENCLEIKCYLQGRKMIIICRKDLKDI